MLMMSGKMKCCRVYLPAKMLSAGVDWFNVRLRKYPYRQGAGTYIITRSRWPSVTYSATNLCEVHLTHSSSRNPMPNPNQFCPSAGETSKAPTQFLGQVPPAQTLHPYSSKSHNWAVHHPSNGQTWISGTQSLLACPLSSQRPSSGLSLHLVRPLCPLRKIKQT